MGRAPYHSTPGCQHASPLPLRPARERLPHPPPRTCIAPAGGAAHPAPCAPRPAGGRAAPPPLHMRPRMTVCLFGWSYGDVESNGPGSPAGMGLKSAAPTHQARLAQALETQAPPTLQATHAPAQLLLLAPQAQQLLLHSLCRRRWLGTRRARLRRGCRRGRGPAGCRRRGGCAAVGRAVAGGGRRPALCGGRRHTILRRRAAGGGAARAAGTAAGAAAVAAGAARCTAVAARPEWGWAGWAGTGQQVGAQLLATEM